MTEKNTIPKHWQVKKLGEVCKLKNGFAFKSDDYESAGISVIRISDIKGGVVSSEKSVRIKPNQEYENYLVEDNDILVAMSGATTGKFGVYKSTEKAYQNQRVGKFKILDDKILNNQFLFYQINSLKRQIEKDAYGGAQPNISSTKIEQMNVALPPLSEQLTIVSKIEELFSELDNGKRQLETAKQQLKVYRQSLLKAAFEGKLTNKNVKEGELPKGWKWVKIEEIATVGTGATPLKGNQKYYNNGKIAWVTSGALNDEFVREATDYVTDLALKETNLSVYPKNTLLLAMYGEGKTRGKCSELLIEATTNQAIAAIHFQKHDVRAKPFLKYYLLKNYNEIRMLSSGGVQPNLNLGIVKRTLIPFPPFEEQSIIVQELESKLTVCDKIEETITQALQQAETLRQSILKKAFEGKLVTAVEEQQETKVTQIPVQEFPQKVSGITETDLQAGIISMVIDLHQNNSNHTAKLNHVKCEKISDLVERKLGISLGRVAMKDAAGPDDYKHLKKVEHRANMAGFFGIDSLPIGYTYKPKRKMHEAIEKVKSVLRPEELSAVGKLLNDFLPFELEHAELVATLFAGWNNLLLMGKRPTDEEIVYESRENWSKRKLSIPRENFFKTLEWMKNHDYLPQGKGQLVLSKEESKKGKTKKSKRKK